MSLRHQPHHKRHDAISLQGNAVRDDIGQVIMNHRGELLFADPAPKAAAKPAAVKAAAMPAAAPAGVAVKPAPAPVLAPVSELGRLDAKIHAVMVEMERFAVEMARADDDIIALQLDPHLPGSIAGRREERKVAARAHKQLGALLAQLNARRDEVVARSLKMDASWSELLAQIDAVKIVMQKLDDTEDAVFRALAKLAPSVVVGDATHSGVTAETTGPMNLPAAVFLQQVALHVGDLEAGLGVIGKSARLMTPSDDADELIFLRSLVNGIRAKLMPTLKTLERSRRAKLEHAATA